MPALILKNQRDLIQLGIIVVAAIIIRLLAITHIPPELGLDNSTYQAAASDILRDGIISNPYIMPLYPLFLALFGGGFGAQVFIGMISGIICVLLVWALAQTLFEDKKVGLVAAGMMAIYPMAIFYSILGLTESVFVPLVLGAFLALQKNKPILASCLLALSILARPTMDLFAPFLIFWHALIIRRTGYLLAFRDLAVYGILYALILSPWWYHNSKKFDHFVRLNHGFGVVLYSGNNPMNTSGGGIGAVDYSVDRVFDQHNPVSASPMEYDQTLRDTAIKYIRENPGKFFKMARVKFFRFWRLMPHTPIVKNSTTAKIATLSLLPIILLACVTLVTRRKTFMYFTPILGFIAFLTLVHMITIGSIRYRYPLEPLLIVIAAPSLILAWNLVFSKKAPATESNRKFPDTP